MIKRALTLHDNKFITYDDNPRDYSMPEFHYHNYYEIYFLVDGKCNFSVENHIYNLKKNDMLIIPPGLIHRAEAYPEMSKRIVLNFAKSCIEDEFKQKLISFRTDSFYIPKDPSYVLSVFENIRKEHFGTDSIACQMSYCYLIILLEYIIRNESYTKTVKPQNSSVKLTERFMKYVADNCFNDISVKDLSNEFGYSPNYITTLFKKNSGIGFKNYVTLQRIKNAEYMLATTDKSIYEIAFLCGFNDSNYFSTLFKKIQGISPREYRSYQQNR